MYEGASPRHLTFFTFQGWVHCSQDGDVPRYFTFFRFVKQLFEFSGTLLFQINLFRNHFTIADTSLSYTMSIQHHFAPLHEEQSSPFTLESTDFHIARIISPWQFHGTFQANHKSQLSCYSFHTSRQYLNLLAATESGSEGPICFGFQWVKHFVDCNLTLFGLKIQCVRSRERFYCFIFIITAAKVLTQEVCGLQDKKF